MTKSNNEPDCKPAWVNEQAGEEKKKRRNGRNGFENYPNAAVNHITNADLGKGDKCPCCHMGKLYAGEDRKLLQFSGSAPVVAEKFIKETLRCNGCNTEFVAKGNVIKWTNSARSSIAIQKCMGIPFYRLSKLQSLYKIPISEANLWQQVAGLWKDGGGLEIFSELLNAASSCENYYVDDTRAKILEVIAANKRMEQEMAFDGSEVGDMDIVSKKRLKGKSCYSTILCTNTSSHEKILYFTRQNYCGSNIAAVIKDGNKKLMSDASAMNIADVSEDILQTITSFKCLRHGYAKFEELLAYYPEECGYFVQEIKSIYQIDRASRSMNEQDRLEHHQKHSTQHIDNIYDKIDGLFADKVVEPNSHLGKAMRYWLNHKEGLTEFLSTGGMDLDNNRSERGLKRIILQRKNSLFFKTLSSAEVLSGISSIIATCMANDIDSFGYLNWIQDNIAMLKKKPQDYLPWKYVEYLNTTEKIAA